jgi:SAM-dependent methyltransferase
MSPTIYADEPAVELPDVLAGRLPPRYRYRMQDVLLERLTPQLSVPGIRILDVGAGRSPTVAPQDRPPGCHYIGLDISGEELGAAGAGAYDEIHVGDVAAASLPFTEQFDVIVSWQVLEHVGSVSGAFTNLYAALRPGGVLLAQLSGSFALFSLIARFTPHRLRVRAMAHFLDHPEELKFPVRYNRCYASALERILSHWTSVELVQFYRGATYFSMFRPLQLAYLKYEDAIAARDMADLATHYLVVATR